MYAAFIDQPVTEESMVWSGWDAALIKSKQQRAKQKVPPNDHDQMSLEEDTVKSAKKVKVHEAGTSECMGTYGLEPYDLKMEQHYDRGEPRGLEPKALRCGLWHMAVGDQRCEPLLPTILKVVADATQKAKRHIKWVTLQKLLPAHLFNKLQVDLSNSIIKFILSVFEMEDFATGCKSKMRDVSIQKLFMEFQTKFVPAGERDFMNMDKCRQNQKISMEVLADWEDKSVQYECLEGLYEQDIAFLLQYRVVTQLADVTWITAKTVSVFKPPDNEIDIEHVVKAMKSFVPLKGESKMQLTLELSRKKCFHVLEHLFVEVCEGFLSDELFKALEGGIEGLAVRRRPITALSVLSSLVSQLQQGIYTLADGKSMLLNYSQECATLPLREGPFGVFSDEVVEVVRNAALERRLQGHHFIGVQDILFSLLHSRVGDHKLVRSGLSKSSPPETPEIPPYRIYKLAGDAAKRCGGELNPVTLEHLVWAVNNVIEGKDCMPVEHTAYPRRLDDMGGAFPRVEAWKDRGLEYDSKPITDCEGLVYAILHGLTFPSNKFRVERLTNN